jgi:hypothetical protein
MVRVPYRMGEAPDKPDKTPLMALFPHSPASYLIMGGEAMPG